MEQFLLNIDTYLVYAAAVLGFCTVAAKGLEPLVKLTKTERDDAILAKVNGYLDVITKFLASVGSLSKSKK